MHKNVKPYLGGKMKVRKIAAYLSSDYSIRVLNVNICRIIICPSDFKKGSSQHILS